MLFRSRRNTSSAQEGRTCHDMWRGVKARVADLLDRAFVPREMILRANDRVTVIRLPIRTQKVLALSAVALLGWTLVASGTFVAQELKLGDATGWERGWQYGANLGVA